MSSQERYNEVHIGGVHLSNVLSGDVSYVENQLKKAIANGTECDTPDGVHYVVRITPTTDIVLRYA